MNKTKIYISSMSKTKIKSKKLKILHKTKNLQNNYD